MEEYKRKQFTMSAQFIQDIPGVRVCTHAALCMFAEWRDRRKRLGTLQFYFHSVGDGSSACG
jgi:hypothetical protein